MKCKRNHLNIQHSKEKNNSKRKEKGSLVFVVSFNYISINHV